MDDDRDLLRQLENRNRFTKHSTNMTTRVTWLNEWTFDMAAREFIQNMVDYLQKMHRDDVRFVAVSARDIDTSTLPTEVTRILKRATEDDECQIFHAVVGAEQEVCGWIFTGPGFFVTWQHNTTLFEEHLYQRSSKVQSIDQAGTHGCGLKEAALFLLWKGASVKMWMPAAPVDDEFPGDTWSFKLDIYNRMKVTASKVKTYKDRHLLTAVTDVDFKWRFNPDQYVTFSPNHVDVVPVPIRRDQGVGYYHVLLDKRYVGRFFNYGIEVQSHPALVALGIGVDSKFKLTDRYRKKVDDISTRVEVVIKSLLRNKPHKILEAIHDKLVTVCLGELRQRWRPEDMYPQDTSVSTLPLAVANWKGVPLDQVVLAGPDWTDAECAIFSSLDYCVLRTKDIYTDFVSRVKDHIKVQLFQNEAAFPILEKRAPGGYTVRKWRDEVQDVPRVVVIESDKIIVVSNSPGNPVNGYEINLQLARDDPATAVHVMREWFAEDVLGQTKPDDENLCDADDNADVGATEEAGCGNDGESERKSEGSGELQWVGEYFGQFTKKRKCSQYIREIKFNLTKLEEAL